MACWPSVALLRDYVCVCNVYHCSWTWWQIPVQRYVALAHAQAMCLRCVCVVLEAFLAWRGVLVAQRFSSLPPLSWFRVSPLRPGFFFFVSEVCSFYFHWASGLSVTGAIVGGWARGLVAGLRVGRPVSVLRPWVVIAVAAPWPMGAQPPLATRALSSVAFEFEKRKNHILYCW